MMNAGTLRNEGIMRHIAFANFGALNNAGALHFHNAFNLNRITNSGTLLGSHSLWNIGSFFNVLGGMLHLGGSFLNIDSLHHTASFFNNGVVTVDSNWYNADTVSGVFGSFTVADSTYNSGWMLGSFDFCDLTPPATAPFVDKNNGTISPQITWCSPQAIDPEFTAEAVCEGIAVTFVNTTTGPATGFLWQFGDGSMSTQISPTHTYPASGTYTVKLIAYNSSYADSTHRLVEVYPLPAAPQLTLSGDTLMCSPGNSLYSWYRNDTLLTTGSSPIFVATRSGYYSVRVTDNYGCISAQSDSVAVTNSTGWTELSSNEVVRVFPNPSATQVIFQINTIGKSPFTKLLLYGVDGKKLQEEDITGRKSVVLLLAQLPSGVLVYELQSAEKNVYGKLIKTPR